MKIKKRVLSAQRVRRVPSQFSWIDHALVRERHYLQQCSTQALALYLVLVTVCDAQGLSYYSDTTLQRMLKISGQELSQGREELSRAGLILYEHPLYQVLCLENTPSQPEPEKRANQSLSAAQILRQIVGGER